MKFGRTTAALALAGVGFLGVAAWLRPGAAAERETPELSTASPGVRFVSVALGGFRGLLADALWVRATGLQDEGRFYELVQLADWITELEPRHAEVWAFHAWNLAYNISVLFPDPSDRWRWVSQGVRMLRDRGIPANPHDDQLHWELGWLYSNKIGGRWDDAQDYYRVALALELNGLFPAGTADYAALAAPAPAAALAAIKLQPETMRTVDRLYGPFDWRLPATHALYWGYTGRQARRGRSVWCARLVYEGLQETVTGGELRFDPAQHLYARAPRLDVAARASRITAADPDAIAKPLSAAPVENFLRESMIYLYAFGREAEAREAMDALQRLPGVARIGSPEAGVRDELRLRMGDLGNVSQERVVIDLLTRHWIWLALGDRGVSAGYERLARLHWEAVEAVTAPTSTIRQAGAWERLDAQARDAARAELPEGLRAAVAGP